ncbi:hypothetical protein PtA15_6A400 [Puccinia triticina]|nr:uncharacterized protein PtA15_6A400 [Puccinia triticina]WAQ85771.1 hypothetical protein PtA15_6A400 [Puccinia triticina]WAR55649.1 hypothetical protein PtB15_6B392 [Puccinia triticina]
MLSKSQTTSSPSAPGPCVKFATLTHRSDPKISPSDQLARRQSYNRARSAGQPSSSAKPAQGFGGATLTAEAARRELILSVTQPGRSQTSNRICSEGSEFANLRRVSRTQASNLAKPHRSRSLQGFFPSPILASQPVIRPDNRPAARVQTEPIPRRLWKKKAKPVYALCHSRAPLAPFLSLPARVLSSMSHINPGNSIKIIQKKVHRAVLVDVKKPSKIMKQSSSSTTSRSPNIRKAVTKYRIKAHEEDHQVLQGFLNNNVIHLEESDPEAAEEAEENQKSDKTRIRSTLLRRIPHASMFPNPIRSSSVGSSQSSSSSNSNNTNSAHSNASTASTSWNRI